MGASTARSTRGNEPELFSKRKRPPSPRPSPPRRGRAFSTAAENSPFGDYFQSGRSCPLSLGERDRVRARQCSDCIVMDKSVGLLAPRSFMAVAIYRTHQQKRTAPWWDHPLQRHVCDARFKMVAGEPTGTAARRTSHAPFTSNRGPAPLIGRIILLWNNIYVPAPELFIVLRSVSCIRNGGKVHIKMPANHLGVFSVSR